MNTVFMLSSPLIKPVTCVKLEGHRAIFYERKVDDGVDQV